MSEQDLTPRALDVLAELEEQVRTLLKLADETAEYQRRLESRCAGYRTTIEELQKQLAAVRSPSESQQLQYLLDEHGI